MPRTVSIYMASTFMVGERRGNVDYRVGVVEGGGEGTPRVSDGNRWQSIPIPHSFIPHS